MFKSHKLNREESETINTILDQEERNIDEYSKVNSTLSSLDDQCRQIWPNWDNFSPTRGQISSMQQDTIGNYQSTAKKRREMSPPKPSSVFVSNTVTDPPQLPKVSNIGDNTTQYKPKYPKSQSSQNTEQNFSKGFDLQNIKTDIDTLYTRIHTMSTGNKPQTPIEKEESPSFRTKYGIGGGSASSGSPKEPSYMQRNYSSNRANINIQTPSRRFMETHTHIEPYTSPQQSSVNDDFSMSSGFGFEGGNILNTSTNPFDVPQVKFPSNRTSGTTGYSSAYGKMNENSFTNYNTSTKYDQFSPQLKPQQSPISNSQTAKNSSPFMQSNASDSPYQFGKASADINIQNVNSQQFTSSSKTATVPNQSSLGNNFAENIPGTNLNIQSTNYKTSIDNIMSNFQVNGSQANAGIGKQNFQSSLPGNTKQNIGSSTFSANLGNQQSNVNAPINGDGVKDQLTLLRSENFKLRSELMKVKKRLQIEEIESRRLEAALEKSTRELQSNQI